MKILERLIATQVLSDFDRYFVRTLQRIEPDVPREVLLAAVFTRKAVESGHVCLHLDHLVNAALQDTGSEKVDLSWPTLPELQKSLADSGLVSDGSQVTPLVLEDDRLYLQRYWSYEEQFVRFIRQKCLDRPTEGRDLAEKLIREVFSDLPAESSKEQQQAVLKAILNNFTVISGGPGTGKTTIIIRILAALIALAHANGTASLKMLLLAPTGKAAARLSDSLTHQLKSLSVPEAVTAQIPVQAATIHRTLGYQPQSPTSFRHNAQNPLSSDVIIVDEASMVDIALMAKLCDAVPKKARLILLGDKDQLASVESGSILGDICQLASQGDVGEATGKEISTPKGHVVELTKSFRFSGQQGIAVLAQAINRGDEERCFEVLASDQFPDVRLYSSANHENRQQDFLDLCLAGFKEYLSAETALAALHEFARFRVLCAHRQGPAGVGRMNALIEQGLTQHGLIYPYSEWYGRRPLLITSNSYSVQLFNGDTGLIWLEGEGKNSTACFYGEDQTTLRSLAPLRLPELLTCYAMTIHKSQGSEFDDVVIVLPEADSPLLTRELLYTAVTRAKRKVSIFASRESIQAALAARVERASGIREKLS